MKIFGHRGAAGLVFENTLASMQYAIDHGVFGIEIDVWKTTDSEIIVFHDTYLDRLTETTGLISGLDSNGIGSLKLKNGDRVPKLIEVIELIKQNNIQLLVEVKSEDAFGLTLDILRKNLVSSQYIVGSFYHEPIKNCKSSFPEIQTAIMFECVPILFDEYISKVNADYIVTSIETHNSYLVDTVKMQGRKLLFYTVNTRAELELAVKAEPFGIITNFPDVLVMNG